MKLIILLTVIGALYCGQLEDETHLDSFVPHYEKWGNGLVNPESIDMIREKCQIMGSALKGEGKIFWDILAGFKWAGYLKPKVRQIIIESPTLAFYDKVNLYCTLPEDIQLKYALVANAKLTEAKQLRDRFLGYMDEAIKQSRINLAQVLCVARDFFNNVINLHDDQDGFRKFAHSRVELYTSMIPRAENNTGVKANAKCELGVSYPEAKYKSFLVLFSKVLEKALDVHI